VTHATHRLFTVCAGKNGSGVGGTNRFNGQSEALLVPSIGEQVPRKVPSFVIDMMVTNASLPPSLTPR